MANTGFKGIDVRQTGNQLVFRAFLQNSSGALLTTGTTTVKLYEVQSDGTFKSYDFNDNTFKTTALTTETLALTHRTGNNSTTNTGVWTAALATLTGFTAGAVYLALVNNSGASPTDQVREFQYGSAEGDLSDTGGNLNTRAAVVADKTGYALTQTFPTNFASMAISGTGVVSANMLEILGVDVSINTDPLPANIQEVADSPVTSIDDFQNNCAVRSAGIPVDGIATGAQIAMAQTLLAQAIELNVSLLQAVRAIGAATGGKRSNAGTTLEQMDAIGNPGTARIVANADASGNGTPTLTLD